MKDLQTGLLTRASTDSAGEQGETYSEDPSISADGRYVAFVSDASNLVPGDTNYRRDVFIKDLQTGVTTRVSTDSAGGQGDDDSSLFSAPSVSADGRYVAFDSLASNLVPGDTVGWDVFVKDLQTGVTACVSTDSTGAQGNHGAVPSLSADGRLISFVSADDNLVPGDTNNQTDVFITPNPLWHASDVVSLSTGPDSWTGTAGNDSVDALAGNDSLDGAAGNDSLIGGDGDDTLVGGSGADTLAGGAGGDSYFVDAGDVIAAEVRGSGVNRVYSTASWTLGDNLHQLYLRGSAPIDGTGNGLNNVLGGNGNANHLYGLGGDDRLWGLAGNDTLDGGVGKDTLFGGAGSDRLVGDAGADRFVFEAAEVGDSRADIDVITDYSKLQGDVVDLPDGTVFTVVSAPGADLRIQLSVGHDIIEFTGIKAAADVLFV